MSDFDEEAEREKLRKRFAEEEKDREATEHMSELLLQGATMTDTHCDECGDPLFRYDGQTFCPTCQRTIEETDAETVDTAAETTDEAPDPTTGENRRIAVTDPRDESTGENHDGQSRRPTPQTGDQPAPRTHDRRVPPSQATNGATAGTAARTGTGRSAGTTDDFAAAEASLSAVLRRQAATAEETDDLGRTREHLAAAREAAEALDAVRTARR